MREKMIFFSILSLLLGLTVYFVTSNIFGTLFLFVCLSFSVLFFLHGIMKDKRETKSIMSWQLPFSTKTKKRK